MERYSELVVGSGEHVMEQSGEGPDSERSGSGSVSAGPAQTEGYANVIPNLQPLKRAMRSFDTDYLVFIHYAENPPFIKEFEQLSKRRPGDVRAAAALVYAERMQRYRDIGLGLSAFGALLSVSCFVL